MYRANLTAFVIGIVFPSAVYFLWHLWKAGWIPSFIQEIIKLF